MNTQDTTTARQVPPWRRVPPGVWVVLALLVLLHGPRGAFWAVLAQAWALVATLLGGDQVVLAVLTQTAPLALATALVVILHRREWITFESLWSVIACSAILIGGASIGAELRALVQRITPPGEAIALAEAPEPSTITLGWLMQRTNQQTNQLSATDAWQALTTWDYVSKLGAADQWPERTPRVALLPEQGSWLVVVGRGVNQLLGYLVIYRPRLFLAALLAGGYLGWLIDGYLQKTHETVADWSYRTSNRRAA